MPSSFNDIIDGVSTSLAIKAPVRAVAESHIALSGLVTVGGVQTTQGMRVLVLDQNDPVDNGIYTASSGAWRRAADFNGTRDATMGTLVFSTAGTLYKLTTANPVVIGESDITWQAIIIVFNLEDPTLHVQQFGAVGDGVTNDTLAFQLAAAAVTALDGARLVFGPGEYIVGLQTLTGALGQGNSYTYEEIITIENCTRPVSLIGYGAKLKAADGLRFGTFDPVTGLPTTIPSPYVDSDYRADAYFGMLHLNYNKNVNIEGFELDGNILNLELGGVWGTSGSYQCRANGIRVFNNEICRISNVYSHHHGLDGIIVGYDGSDEFSPTFPTTIENCSCPYNGRDALSIVGGKGVTVINGNFSHTGKDVPVGWVGSDPGSGCDIEAENASIRNIKFINCEFINNERTGIVAGSGDSADIVFENCLFWGTTGTPIWADKPNMTFRGCRIYGTVFKGFPGTSRFDGLKFYGCHFEDKIYTPTGTVYLPGDQLVTMADFNFGLFQDCTFVANECGFGFIVGAVGKQWVARNCNFLLKYDGFADNSFASNFQHCLFENCYFDEDMASPPATAYYILVQGAESYTGLGNYFASTKLKGFSSGATGAYQQVSAQWVGAGTTRERALRNYFSGAMLAYGLTNSVADARFVGFGDSAPGSGTWTRGDIVFSVIPSAGGKVGWVCTTAGSPGVWKPFGVIDA